jgi:small subunit ribosomal protein S6
LRTYEALFIVQPESTDEETQTVVDGVEKLVADNGGTVVRSDVWGKRRLAYEVKGHQEGVYVLVRFESPAEFVDVLEGHFRLNEAVIRALVVHFDAKTLRLEEEQARRTAALAESRNAGGDRSDGDDDAPRGRRRESNDD